MPDATSQTEEVVCMSPYINYGFIIHHLLLASDKIGETTEIIRYAKSLIERQIVVDEVEAVFASFDEIMSK